MVKRQFFWVADVLQKNREIKNPLIGGGTV